MKQSLVQSKYSESVSHDEDDEGDGDGGGSGSGDDGNYDACLSQSFFLPLFLLITCFFAMMFLKIIFKHMGINQKYLLSEFCWKLFLK